jgi:hypothetical protein
MTLDPESSDMEALELLRIDSDDMRLEALPPDPESSWAPPEEEPDRMSPLLIRPDEEPPEDEVDGSAATLGAAAAALASAALACDCDSVMASFRSSSLAAALEAGPAGVGAEAEEEASLVDGATATAAVVGSAEAVAGGDSTAGAAGAASATGAGAAAGGATGGGTSPLASDGASAVTSSSSPEPPQPTKDANPSAPAVTSAAEYLKRNALIVRASLGVVAIRYHAWRVSSPGPAWPRSHHAL